MSSYDDRKRESDRLARQQYAMAEAYAKSCRERGMTDDEIVKGLRMLIHVEAPSIQTVMAKAFDANPQLDMLFGTKAARAAQEAVRKSAEDAELKDANTVAGAIHKALKNPTQPNRR